MPRFSALRHRIPTTARNTPGQIVMFCVSKSAVLVMVATGVMASAQTSPARQAAAVIGAVPNVSAVSETGPASELTIRWNVAQNATDEPLPAGDLRPLNQFQVMARRAVTPAFVRERAPQLSTDHLVVTAIDVSGREVAWQQVKDPRIVRAETPGANMELSGQKLYRPVTELIFSLPDALAAVAIRVYEVQWNGTEFVLQELGEIAVAK